MNENRKRFAGYLCLVLGLFFLAACSDTLSPRPKGYPRMYFPDRQYEVFDSAHCGYVFAKPVYAHMLKDPKYTKENACWYNLWFEPFDATLHISYHEFHTPNEFDSLFEDTRKLVYKHIIRADDIEEIEIESESDRMSGLIFQLKGNTATNLNFYLSDNEYRYFRGALYFNSKTEPDSIAPVYQFLREDILHLISNFEWKENNG